MIKLKKLNSKELLIDDESKFINLIIQINSPVKIRTVFDEKINGRIKELNDFYFVVSNSCEEFEIEYEEVTYINGEKIDSSIHEEFEDFFEHFENINFEKFEDFLEFGDCDK